MELTHWIVFLKTIVSIYVHLQPLADAYGLLMHRNGQWEWTLAPGVSPSPRYEHAAVSYSFFHLLIIFDIKISIELTFSAVFFLNSMTLNFAVIRSLLVLDCMLQVVLLGEVGQ